MFDVAEAWLGVVGGDVGVEESAEDGQDGVYGDLFLAGDVYDLALSVFGVGG